MRKLFVVTALVVALLSGIGLGSARCVATGHPVAAHAQLLADSTPYGPVCPGGGSTGCH